MNFIALVVAPFGEKELARVHLNEWAYAHYLADYYNRQWRKIAVRNKVLLPLNTCEVFMLRSDGQLIDARNYREAA